MIEDEPTFPAPGTVFRHRDSGRTCRVAGSDKNWVLVQDVDGHEIQSVSLMNYNRHVMTGVYVVIPSLEPVDLEARV